MVGEPLLDLAHLAAQTGGDDGLAREILALFQDQCRRLLPRIADDALPPDERADLAHTLQGSALGVGALRVGRCAAAVEQGLRGRAHAAEALRELAGSVEQTLVLIEGRD